MAAALAVKFAALCGCSGAMAQAQPKPAPICGGDEIARGIAKRVIDATGDADVAGRPAGGRRAGLSPGVGPVAAGLGLRKFSERT